MEPLIDTLNAIGILEPGLEKLLRAKLKKAQKQKEAYLVKPEMIADRIYFIEKGSIRGYKIEDDKERTYYFLTAGDVCISVRSFLKQVPAKEYIQCMDACTLWGITYKEYVEALERFPSFNLHRAFLLEKYYILSIEREDMRQLGAYGKFSYLMKNQPHLLQNIEDQLLASYLGMDKGTFSRMKRKYQEEAKKRG